MGTEILNTSYGDANDGSSQHPSHCELHAADCSAADQLVEKVTGAAVKMSLPIICACLLSSLFKLACGFVGQADVAFQW